jgi:hypothetical protein
MLRKLYQHSRFDSKLIRFYTFFIRVSSLTTNQNGTRSNKSDDKYNAFEYDFLVICRLFEPYEKRIIHSKMEDSQVVTTLKKNH